MSGILESIQADVAAMNKRLDVLQDLIKELIKPQVDLRNGGMRLAKNILGLSADTIRTHCKSGKIPHTVKNGRLRFNAQELLDYLRQSDTPTVAAEAERMRAGGRRVHQHPASTTTRKAS